MRSDRWTWNPFQKKFLRYVQRPAPNEHIADLQSLTEDYLNGLEDQVSTLKKALTALAKVQYDGTVEGLRRQAETEDWGDVLDVEETKAAYELVLAALGG